ncbi:hypothetical protein T484DRAFT_1811148 [Baffinella frigidus]|nr:hypothetical protein T484DRAFT_1811148 [Cryptophyta sp. CCMP2293]
MLEMREMRPAPLPPVALLAMPDKVEVDQDTTCAVCLEECLLGAASGAGMLPCRHIFHEACIEQWLSAHNECPT